MEELNFKNIAIENIRLLLFSEKRINTDVLRLDKIHETISGNKWFKLRYYLEDAKKQGKTTILSFGGAWSNHLLATAAACQLQNLKSIGIVRGEKPLALSPMLLHAARMGMELVYTSREDYRNKLIPQPYKDRDFYRIPEGGFGNPGMEGAATMVDFFPQKKYTHICCAAGTGTSAAGLLKSAEANTEVIVVSVLKKNLELEKNIQTLVINHAASLKIKQEYSFGGYAKYNRELIGFMNWLYSQTGIPTDFVYTGKLFYAIHDLVVKDYFPAGAEILIIHSGGLKGNDSLDKGTLIF